jgi:hypothetical protein
LVETYFCIESRITDNPEEVGKTLALNPGKISKEQAGKDIFLS